MRRVRRPLREFLLIFDRNAEHLTDQGRRDRLREIGDEVHRTLVCDAVQQRVGNRLDPPAPRFDRTWRERLRYEISESGVGRRILEQHENSGAWLLDVLTWKQAIVAAHPRRHVA